MRWLRRLLIATLCLLVLALLAGGVAYKELHGKPTWYDHKPLAPEDRERAASRVEDKIQETMNWSAMQAEHRRIASAPIDEPLELSLSEEEINAFFSKWDEAGGWSAQYGKFFSDPQLFLRDGKIILAATATQLSAVISIELKPRLDEQGNVQLEVVRVSGGDLPLPKSLWSSYSGNLAAHLQQNLKPLESAAKLNPDGSANNDLAAATFGKMLIDFLSGRPASPVIYIPYFQDNGQRNLAVKLTALQIGDKSADLTFTPAK